MRSSHFISIFVLLVVGNTIEINIKTHAIFGLILCLLLLLLLFNFKIGTERFLLFFLEKKIGFVYNYK